MAKNYIKVNAKVVDTVRPAIAGADRHPRLERAALDRGSHDHAAAARRLSAPGQSVVVGA